MPAPATFETARMTAERLDPSHLAPLIEMHADAEVMATLGGVRSAETTARYLKTNLDHWAAHGFGLWIFHDRDTGQFIGRGGVRHETLETGPEIEIAYALMSLHWGQGLGTEMAQACVNVGVGELALDDLVAVTLTTNLASRGVMAKAGFRYERDITHAGLPHVLYRHCAHG